MVKFLCLINQFLFLIFFFLILGQTLWSTLSDSFPPVWNFSLHSGFLFIAEYFQLFSFRILTASDFRVFSVLIFSSTCDSSPASLRLPSLRSLLSPAPLQRTPPKFFPRGLVLLSLKFLSDSLLSLSAHGYSPINSSSNFPSRLAPSASYLEFSPRVSSPLKL